MQVPLVVKHVSRKIEEQMNLNVFFAFQNRIREFSLRSSPLPKSASLSYSWGY